MDRNGIDPEGNEHSATACERLEQIWLGTNNYTTTNSYISSSTADSNAPS